MRRAIVQDNVATGALTGVSGEDRGFFQCWSKSDKDWEVTFQRNTLTNFVFALQVATATFYNADYHSDRHLIVSETGSYSNVTYGASFSYPWLTGTFAPENETRLPNKAPRFRRRLNGTAGIGGGCGPHLRKRYKNLLRRKCI